ncbi:MAG: hypothetical protein IPQ09_10520 [Myxococcales bacterium]|nr:hypothetical protein [Myxococcales bacterium]
MGPGALLRTLESLARALGVEVRAELGRARGGGPSRGGACKLNGRMVVFVEASGSSYERACVVTSALTGLDLSGVPVSEEVAAFLRARPRPARLVPLEQFRPLAKARARLRRHASAADAADH